MIGLALTGAKLAGSLLGNLLAKKAAASQNQPVSGNLQADKVTLGPGAVNQAPTTPNLLGVVQGAANMLPSLIGKAGAPAISGVGGLLKTALSTLNDDEWFEKYDGNGATFNEQLIAKSVKDSTTESGNTYYATAAYVYGALASYAMADRTNGAYYDQFMPHILAYIRSKTNNILQDDVTTYERVYFNVVKLYEIYYSLRKWEKFMLDTPANCPTVINVNQCYQPANVNVTRGIADNLESYLRATVKLPYALASYIRWRFGTMFLSTNTKRAGFVTYEPLFVCATAVNASTHDLTINTGYGNARTFTPRGNVGGASTGQLSTIIENIKTQLVTDGRALSDFAMAYADHEVKYDVEDRHFDEKEFCLRQNILRWTSTRRTSPSTGLTPHVYPADTIDILMDSRIDMNAGTQAITISTGSFQEMQGITHGLAPFPVNTVSVFIEGSSLDSTTSAGITGSSGGWSNTTGSTFLVSDVVYNPSIAGHSFNMKWSQSFTAAEYWQGVSDALRYAAEVSLELHNANSFDLTVSAGSTEASYPQFMCQVGTLSYDRARISIDSLKSLQRNAILNLVRGEYKRKAPIDVKEDATTVVDGLTSKNVEFTDKKIEMK